MTEQLDSQTHTHPKGICSHKEETPVVPFHWNRRQTPGRLRIFTPLSEQVEKGDKILADMTDSDDLKKIRLLLYNRMRGRYVQPRGTQGYIRPPCPVVKVNRRLKQQKQENRVQILQE